MIDTEKNINIKQPIKMIDFNPKTFVNDNLMIMVNYINKLAQTNYTIIDELPESLYLTLNEKGNLVVRQEQDLVVNYDRFYGCKPHIDKRLRIRHENETNEDWAKRILQSYCRWLLPYYQAQANANVPKQISVKQFCHIQLFTDVSYIDWVMQRLDELDNIDIDNLIIDHNMDYALSSFITKISQYKEITHSTLRNIISAAVITADIEAEANEETKSPMLWITFLKILIDIINGKDGLPKITYNDSYYDYTINFTGLIKRCQQLGLTITKLPLEALISYTDAHDNKSQSMPTPITITIRDINDIKYPEFCNDKVAIQYLDNEDNHLSIDLNGFRTEIEALLAHPDDYGDNHYYLSNSKRCILQKVLQCY